MSRPIMPSLVEAVEYITGRVFSRLDGLGGDEYFWEPVGDCWSVRSDGDRWVVDRVRPEPDPPPVTTIAWRSWHIADCLASYVEEFGGWGLSVGKLPDGRDEWFGEPEEAVAELHRAVEVFLERIQALGEDGLHRELGPRWGPFAESTWTDLVIHAIDEVAHHGAEIALLRDLYPRLTGSRVSGSPNSRSSSG